MQRTFDKISTYQCLNEKKKSPHRLQTVEGIVNSLEMAHIILWEPAPRPAVLEAWEMARLGKERLAAQVGRCKMSLLTDAISSFFILSIGGLYLLIFLLLFILCV